MSVSPAIGFSSVSTPQGIADQLADLQRQIRRTANGASYANAVIAPGSITGAHIAAGTITTDLIQAGAIQAGNIAANAIQTVHLAAGSVVAAKIGAGEIVAGKLAAGAIQAGNIAAGAIQTADLAALSITTDRIAALAVTAGKIAAGAVTSDKITVTSLSAISSNMGSITAGTIQGATLQTAGSGSRVVIDSSGIKGYALDGTTQNFKFDTGTGIATVTGVIIAQGASSIPGSALTGTIAIAALPALPGTNLLKDSSFESTEALSTYWSLYNNSLSPAPTLDRTIFAADSQKYGPTVARLVNGTDTSGDMGLVTSAAVRPSVTAGTKYTASAWVRPGGASLTATVWVHWWDSSDGLLSAGAISTSVPVSSGGWTRIAVTGDAPINAVKASIYVWFTNPTSGQSCYVDGVQFEEGALASPYAPRPDEILAGTVGTNELQALAVTAAKIAANTITATQIASATITSTQIAAGTIIATNIASGAITAQKLNLTWGGSNVFHNAAFSYWGVGGDPGVSTADSPGYWQHYDNGGTAASPGWSKITNGGPEIPGGASYHSWRLQVNNAITTVKGFMNSEGGTKFDPNTVWIHSFYWKGNTPPAVTSNGGWQYEWLDPDTQQVLGTGSVSPTAASTTAWKRYAVRMTMDATGGRLFWNPGGGSTSGWDYSYIFPSTLNMSGGANSIDVQLALPQLEKAQVVSSWAPAPSELLPYSVGNTVLGPDSVTTAKILAGTIQGSDIAATTITGTNIAGVTITAAHIASGTITATQIAGSTITASQIASGTITATQIAANTITADKINFRLPSRNLLKDSAFLASDSLNSWSGNNSTLSRNATGGPIGNGPYVIATAGATPAGAGAFQQVFGLVAGVQYSASGWFKSPSTVREFVVSIDWRNASNVNVGGSAVILGTSTSSWQRFDTNNKPQTIVAPAGAVQAYVHFHPQAIGGGNTVTGEAQHMAYLKFEEGDLATTWSQNVDPTVIDGATITAPIIRTSATNPKLQLDGTNGLYLTDNAGTIVSQFKAGAGGLDLTAGADSTLPDQRKIRLRGSIGGAYNVGEVYSWEQDVGTQVQTETVVLTNGPSATAAGGYMKISTSYHDTVTTQRTGSIFFFATGGVGASGAPTGRWLLTNGAVSDWQFASSDKKLKNSIRNTNRDPMPKIRSLRPVIHKWNPGQGPPGEYAGMVAQEVREHLPEVIVPLPDNKLGIDSRSMLAVLVEAIQALDKRLDVLEHRQS